MLGGVSESVLIPKDCERLMLLAVGLAEEERQV